MPGEEAPKAAAEAPPQAGEKEAAKPSGKGGPSALEKFKLFAESLSPRERTIVKVTLFVFCVLFIDLIIIRPITGYLNKLDEEIRVQENVVPKRLLILKHKDSILRDYKAGETLMTDPKLTQEEEIAKLLGEIERVSKSVHLFIFNINPVKTLKKSESIYELEVDIEGKGGINQIRTFIAALEEANPPIRVSGFTLRPQGKESEDLKCMIAITKIGVKKNPIAYEL